MRPTPTLLVAALLALAGCGGDDSTDAGTGDAAVTPDAENGSNGDGDSDGDSDGGGRDGDGGSDGGSDEVGGESGQDPDFDVTTLPEDFPAELVPPVWETGQYTLATDFPTATFESSMPFDEIVTYYDSVHGEGVVLGDEPGARVAEWTDSPPWIVSVFEDEPVRIGISQIPDG